MVRYFSVIPANDADKSKFGHRNLSSPVTGMNPGPLAPEVSALTTELLRFPREHNYSDVAKFTSLMKARD